MKFTKNTAQWKGMKKRLQASRRQATHVGFFDTYYGPENDNLPVATVALWNNEGIGIPKRAFMDEGFIEEIKKSPEFNEKLLYKMGLVAEGKMNMSQLLSSIGPELAAMMKQEIIEFSTPGNSPLTIALKGKDDPLRDTDTMLNSVDWQLGLKGGS